MKSLIFHRQIFDPDQDIEPEVFFLSFAEISDVDLEKKCVCFKLKNPIHPCVEKFFGENQGESAVSLFLHLTYIFIPYLM
jgi:hypothetical protein